MKNIFKPHGFMPIDPDRPGFARAIFKSRVNNHLFFQAILEDETVRYESVGNDGEPILVFNSEIVGDLTESWSNQDHEIAENQPPLYVFSWGNGEVTAGTKDKVASTLIKKIESLIALPHIYASVAEFIYSTPSMRGTRIDQFRETDSRLLFDSDQDVALLQLREKDIVSRLSAEHIGRASVGDEEVQKLIELRREEGSHQAITELASFYLKMKRNEEATEVLRSHRFESARQTSHLPWLSGLDDIEPMLRFADRELVKGKNRLAKLTYSKALDRMTQRGPSDTWYRIARYSVSRRLERLGGEREVVASFEWMLLDCLVKELTCIADHDHSGFDYARRTLLLLGDFYTSSGLFQEARDIFVLASEPVILSSSRSVARLKSFRWQLLMSKASLAERTGNFEAAETGYEEAISLIREGEEHGATLGMLASVLGNLSRFYLGRGRLVAAEATANEALAIRRIFALAGIPESKSNLQETMNLLERLYIDVDRDFELSLLRKSLDIPMRRAK
ncbi:tetratricopeptide repeat protein [Paraburkholderia terrae]